MASKKQYIIHCSEHHLKIDTWCKSCEKVACKDCVNERHKECEYGPRPPYHESVDIIRFKLSHKKTGVDAAQNDNFNTLNMFMKFLEEVKKSVLLLSDNESKINGLNEKIESNMKSLNPLENSNTTDLPKIESFADEIPDRTSLFSQDKFEPLYSFAKEYLVSVNIGYRKLSVMRTKFSSCILLYPQMFKIIDNSFIACFFKR